MQPPEAESGGEALPGVTVTVPEERTPGPGAASPPYRTGQGSRFPLGASAHAEGVNFCVFSRHATRVTLLLYAGAGSPEPYQTIELAPERNRTYSFWHVFVEGLPAGAHYAWRMDGPNDTRETGRSFAPHKDLVDPCARAVTTDAWDRRRAADPHDDGHAGIRAIVAEGLPARPVAPAELAGAVDVRTARGRLHALTPRAACGTPAPSRAWSRRSPTCATSGLRTSSCCR